MAELEIDLAYGYNGTPVHALPGNTVCYVCGCGLQFYNLIDGSRSFLWSPQRRPVSAVAFNSKLDMFAFADRGKNPKIYIHSYPDKRSLYTLSGASKLECGSLAFDRPGTQLVTLGTLPEFELQVWSLEGYEPTVICEASATTSHAKHVSFNPWNPQELCTSGSGHVTFWRLEKQQSKLTLVATEGQAVSSTSRFQCHAWGLNSEVYVGCNEGELYRFDIGSGVGEMLPDSTGTEPVSAVAVSKHHLIAASEDGFVRFYSHTSKAVEKTTQLNSAFVSTLQFMPDWGSLVVGCGDGVIFSIRIPGYESPQLSEDEFRDCTPKVTVIADFHSGSVTSCAHLILEKCLATIGSDSTLRIWDYGYNVLKSKTNIGERPTCMAVGQSAMSHILLAVGHGTGTVRIVNVEDPNAPKVVMREKLDEAEVLKVVFDPESGTLCVVMANGKLFWIDVPESVILGWTQLDLAESKINDVCWVEDTPPEPMVLVSMTNGDVMAFKVPRPVDPAETPTYEVKREELLDNVWKLDYAAVRMTYAKQFQDKHQILVLAEDRCLKVTFLTKDRQVELKEEAIPLSKAVLSFQDFAKLGTSLSLSPDKTQLLCSGADGKCIVREVAKWMVEDPPKSLESQAAKSVQRHWPFGQGITAAAWATDGKTIFSTGADGYTFCCRFKGARKDVAPYTLDAQEEADEELEEEDIFTVKRQKEEERFTYMSNQPYREEVKAKVAKMAERLIELKEANGKAEEMEKLEPQEFMVESVKEEARAEGDKMVERVREEMRWENVERDYTSDRIKKECYDTMEAKIVIIHGMIADLEVPNFNVRLKDKKAAALLKKIKFMRKVQLEEFQRAGQPNFVDDIYLEEEEGEGEPGSPMSPTSGSPLSPKGLASPGSPGAETDKEDDKGKEGEAKDGKGEGEGGEGAKPVKITNEMLADESTKEIAYSPFEEYTRHRACTQMWMLTGEINALKKAFNAEHSAMLVRKKADNSKINEKNVRISAILAELENEEPIFEPKPHADEQPEKILEVKDSEIKVEKYHSPEDLAKQEAARLEDARRRAEQEDDSVERGLKIMMDGKLERDENVVQVITKPEFADTKPQEEWTDEELKAYKDYENKLKKQEEEEEKKRKQLEAELKQIKKENQEIAKGFDEALLAMLNSKLATDQQIYELELRIIKLSQYVMQREEMEIKVAKLAVVLDDIQTKSAKAQKHVLDFKRELDAMAERYQQHLADERNADKRFRAHFAEAEEYLELLLKLLKKKSKQKGKSKLQEQQEREREEQAASIDPFAGAETKVKAQVTEPDVKLDKPDGLSDIIWQEFLQWRQGRLEAEREMKECAQELADMQKYHLKIKTEEEELGTKMHMNLRKLNDFHEQMVRDSYNLDFLQRYKQGQIEVEQAAVVTDYADAILIHNSRIQELNADIRASGTEKVKILKEIKDFKKGIRAVEWETEMLDYTTGTLEVEYRHLHTLRVTKAMQEFIKGGGEGHNETERAKLLKKIEHVKKTFEQKVEEKRKGILKIKRLVKEKAMENNGLEDSTAQAHQLVKERDEIVSLQSTGLDQVRAAKMMKDLRVTRKLEDVAKAQQDELMELKTRIDKLRERTFPSFAVVSKRVVGNPDEKDGPGV
uniref:Cilia- and flagella-associated protein 43 n=1 Tax=Eutreptiella gymnastica TaxID=73025 RepID=A0A7S4G316_9EUGL|mmetsp:Transcript_13134/g.24117  ORF Transcript_13134/g.24117 Transcript_13134/m.24117 type:complete len:1618 (+) Transcript_13134:139-4992(+)